MHKRVFAIKNLDGLYASINLNFNKKSPKIKEINQGVTP